MKGCVALLYWLCLLGLTTLISATRSLTFSPDTGTPSLDNQTISLQASSEFLLFSVQNSTNGINLTITPLCLASPCGQPQSLVMVNVVLSHTCSLSPCQLLVSRTNLSSSTVQYIIGIPSSRSVSLLRLHYGIKTKEIALVDSSIAVINYQCSPSTFIYFNGVYNTLCLGEGSLTVLQIQELDNFDKINIISLVTVALPTLPIVGVIVLDYSDSLGIFWLFVFGGKTVLQINLDTATMGNVITLDECTEAIHDLKLLNYSTEIASYLVHCKDNYLQLNYSFSDSGDDPLIAHYSYRDFGYPVICTSSGLDTAQLNVIQVGSDYILNYNDKHIEFRGAILLQQSFCFESEDQLFYVYTDQYTATYVLNVGETTSEKLDHQCGPGDCQTSVSLFNDRYLLVQTDYETGNATLLFYDAQLKTQNVRAVQHESNLLHLIVLPQEKMNVLSYLGFIAAVPVGILLALLIILGVARRRYETRRRQQQGYQVQGPTAVQDDSAAAFIAHGGVTNTVIQQHEEEPIQQPSSPPPPSPGSASPVLITPHEQNRSNNKSLLVTGSERPPTSYSDSNLQHT